MSNTSKNYLELELICITASRILKMVDYNVGVLSEEEYIFQSRGIIKGDYKIICVIQALLTELVVKTGRILAKFFIDRDEVEVNKIYKG